MLVIWRNSCHSIIPPVLLNNCEDLLANIEIFPALPYICCPRKFLQQPCEEPRVSFSAVPSSTLCHCVCPPGLRSLSLPVLLQPPSCFLPSLSSSASYPAGTQPCSISLGLPAAQTNNKQGGCLRAAGQTVFPGHWFPLSEP